jgi:hypothetical protein
MNWTGKIVFLLTLKSRPTMKPLFFSKPKTCMLILSLLSSSSFAYAKQSFAEKDVQFGLDAGFLTYKESVRGKEFMHADVKMLGLDAKVTLPLKGQWSLIPEARLAIGDNAYYGGIQTNDGQYYPITETGTLDVLMKIEMNAAYHWTEHFSSNMGVGYRFFQTDDSVTQGGYLRRSNYFYLPLSINYASSIQGNWKVDTHIEQDVFLLGKQYSDLRSHVPRQYFNEAYIKNTQRHGYGMRASMDVQKKGTAVHVKPYFQYWHIADSDVSALGGFEEPNNQTKELGIGFTWQPH